jgi:hypothetical protein
MDYDIHDLALFLEFSLEKYSKLRRDQTMLLSLFKPLFKSGITILLHVP